MFFLILQHFCSSILHEAATTEHLSVDALLLLPSSSLGIPLAREMHCLPLQQWKLVSVPECADKSQYRPSS
jgi:hypothetical protein